MDFMDVALFGSVFLAIVILGAIIVGGIVDASTNGINDCIDEPQYCKTVQEYKKYWPEYQIPKEGLGK